MSNELFKKMEKLLEKAPENRPSYFQMKHFILGTQPTTQAQLWQCLRELETKKDSIDNLELEIANQKDQLSLIQIDLEKTADEGVAETVNKRHQELHDKSKQIRINMLKRQEESIAKNINKLEKKLDFVIQEARFYVQAFESLSAHEEMKDFDDYEAQKEYWEAKITQEINLKSLSKYGVSSDLLQITLALPEDSPIQKSIIGLLDKVGLTQEKNDQKNIGHRQDI